VKQALFALLVICPPAGEDRAPAIGIRFALPKDHLPTEGPNRGDCDCELKGPFDSIVRVKNAWMLVGDR